MMSILVQLTIRQFQRRCNTKISGEIDRIRGNSRLREKERQDSNCFVERFRIKSRKDKEFETVSFTLYEVEGCVRNFLKDGGREASGENAPPAVRETA